MLFDTHAHVQFKAFSQDHHEVIERSLAQGMRLVLPSTQLDTSKKAVHLSKEYEALYAAVGIHPIHALEERFDHEAFRALAKDAKTVAIGEVGLDHFRQKGKTEEGRAAEFEKQEEVLKAFLALAQEVNKPVILHCRNAYDALYTFLDAYPNLRAVVHCFTGVWAEARKFLHRGFLIGITGIVTYPDALNVHEVVRKTPLDRLLLETDSPYLTPVPHRGERNEPLFVEYTARKIAELKGISFEEVAKRTWENAEEFLVKGRSGG